MNKKITLINPPWYFEEKLEALSQNLGLGYLAGWLEKFGHEVKIIDALTEGKDNILKLHRNNQSYVRAGLSYEEIVRRIDPKSDYIGITAPFTNHQRIAKELCEALKKRFPHIPLVIGGVYPSTLPEHALNNTCADFIVKGEGEIPLKELLEGKTWRDIRGLWFRENGAIVSGDQSEFIQDLDSIPFPARHLLPMDEYLALSPRHGKHERTAAVITSRGCPFKCDFCSVHPVCGYQWRARSVDNVIDEIKTLVDSYGVEHIAFEDDNLTVDRRRALSIFEKMKGLNLPLTWSAPNGVRIDTLNEDLILKMKESGCVMLWLAVESGDEKILKRMNKKLDLSKVIEITRLCVKIGVTIGVFFLVGYPGETRASYEKTLAFAHTLKRLGVEYFYFFIVNAYPGTLLYEYCREQNYLCPQTDDTLFLLNKVVTIETEDFDYKEVFRRQKYAQQKFLPLKSKIMRLFLSPENERRFYLRYWALKKKIKKLL